MPRKRPPTPPEKRRAPKGESDAVLLLRMPEELRALAAFAARRRGVSVSEWWREAGRQQVAREAVAEFR